MIRIHDIWISWFSLSQSLFHFIDDYVPLLSIICSTCAYRLLQFHLLNFNSLSNKHVLVNNCNFSCWILIRPFLCVIIGNIVLAILTSNMRLLLIPPWLNWNIPLHYCFTPLFHLDAQLWHCFLTTRCIGLIFWSRGFAHSHWWWTQSF